MLGPIRQPASVPAAGRAVGLLLARQADAGVADVEVLRFDGEFDCCQCRQRLQ